MKQQLPTGVQIHQGWFQYRHRVPKKDRASSNFKFDSQGRCPRVKLCKEEKGYQKMIIALGKAIADLKMKEDAADPYLSLGWLYNEWKSHIPAGKGMGSRAYQGLAKATRQRYDTAAVILDHEIKSNGLPADFRTVRADQVETVTIRRILDKRYLSGSTPANLNNELALLGSMYKFGKQYLSELGGMSSPTRGIEKFTVKKRTRFVTDEDYDLQYKIAGAIGLPHIQDYMELAFLLAARSIEVTDLKIGQGIKEGIIIIRAKGSLNTGILWNDRLRAAWKRALERHNTTHPDSLHNLLTDHNGRQVSQSTIHDHWGRVRDEMKKRGLSEVYFTVQNLKVKGVKTAKDKAIAGQSEAMQRYYQDTGVDVEWYAAPETN